MDGLLQQAGINEGMYLNDESAPSVKRCWVIMTWEEQYVFLFEFYVPYYSCNTSAHIKLIYG